MDLLTRTMPNTGKRVWRFYTVPGAGRTGGGTWSGDAWKRGGGATWITGTYDPDLNLIYWGTGNPGPDMDGDVRPGDNLYSCSLVALDADTGKLKWHYQFTPHDVHDWDAVGDPVLVDVELGGRKVKAVIQANRNGFSMRWIGPTANCCMRNLTQKSRGRMESGRMGGRS